MKSVVVSNPEILSGTPVFAGTRVPVKNLTDYLEGGSTIDEFLDDFPSVTREQVVAFLEEGEAADLAALARAQELEIGKVTPKSQAEVFQKARSAL